MASCLSKGLSAIGTTVDEWQKPSQSDIYGPFALIWSGFKATATHFGRGALGLAISSSVWSEMSSFSKLMLLKVLSTTSKILDYNLFTKLHFRYLRYHISLCTDAIIWRPPTAVLISAFNQPDLLTGLDLTRGKE